ncbi:MAG TPA: hypothetical protein VGK78_18965 [Nocardioides sp.]|uniref:hypothetical protein n=1 Tax=Nocardioides sp. TaxID=35761 RepID=UPI002F4112CA
MRTSSAGLLLGGLVASVLTLSTPVASSGRPAEPAAVDTSTSTSTRTATRTATRIALAKPTTSYHYIVNVRTPRAAKRLGFNVIDTGTSQDQIDALPRGTQAMVWVGEKCPTRIDGAFRSLVRRLAGDRKVFGYFLSDEPHISDCPKGPRHLAAKADFIRKTSGGRQKSFIVLCITHPPGYHAFRPRVTHVTMVGIDPYPCSVTYPSCNYGLIRHRVRQAARAGIPRRLMVPTFQAFGQEKLSGHYYNLPTAYQLKRILNRWAALVPNPKMDFTYGWGHRAASNPTLVDSTALKDLLQRYFQN